MENVILTPHVAGAAPQYLQLAMEIVRHNLKVCVGRSGRMINVVDPTLEY